jgi:thymidine phosphorylase
MVAGLGGPADLMERPGHHLPRAPVVRAVMPPPGAEGRFVGAIDTRALGLAVVALGGGRRLVGDRIDPAVGLASLAPLGTCLDKNTPLAIVHAADEAGADAAAAMVRDAYRLADTAPTPGPLVADHITVHR